MKKVKQLPPRGKVKESDRWDLGSLFPDDDAWETAFAAWEKRIPDYARVPGQTGRQRRRRSPRASSSIWTWIAPANGWEPTPS